MTYRILVVDDQEMTTSLVTRYLEARGLQAVAAASGPAAIERCREAFPDAILMDVQMPGMDGLEATRQIRQLPGGAAVPIVAFTALAMRGDRERCLAAGMNDYISKPVRMADLHDRIIHLLGNKPHADFLPVGTTTDFPLGKGRMVVVSGRHVAVFRLDDGFFAIDNLCLHQAGPLCEGDIEDGAVTCPWHGWSYDIRTGILVQDGKVGVSRHNTRVVGDQVQVQLTD